MTCWHYLRIKFNIYKVTVDNTVNNHYTWFSGIFLIQILGGFNMSRTNTKKTIASYADDFANPNVWEYEQDYFEGKYSGYEYIIKRTCHLGILCGYVRVKSRKLQKYDYDSYDLDAHGGITFGGDIDSKKGYWLGFDCGHLGDLVPCLDLRYPEFNLVEEGIYRDLRYVRRECKQLIKQIKQMERDA